MNNKNPLKNVVTKRVILYEHESQILEIMEVNVLDFFHKALANYEKTLNPKLKTYSHEW